ncbi:endoglucanase [Loktanella atrilutea]|uniref:cellulase n=1 Tax=Loktanella atrilutea TaxID=366533 RepID=A0A1M5EZH3_LOKAT|nr:glycosyl hydrolase family 8 [Loktanella atrilutea]SHF84654.1 endoglucanase [Loktanella atrilutea]
MLKNFKFKLTRRSAIQGCFIFSFSIVRPSSGYAESNVPTNQSILWPTWKSRFLSRDGRIVDAQNGGISHSEGQGYGALLAQANGDREAFDRIEAWTRANLLVRQDHLMAWRWHPERGVAGQDWQSATDGDLFRAWALLRAQRDSGWTGMGDAVSNIAQDIASLCIQPDPREPSAPLLTPGAEARTDQQRVLINPSYIMPRALRELGLAANQPNLIAAADHGEQVLSELAALGPIPDWIDVKPDGFVTAPEYGRSSGYDALRVPLFLIWSDRFNHPAVARAAAEFATADTLGHVAVLTTSDSGLVAQSNQRGYLAIAALANCEPLNISRYNLHRQSYYPATLQLLSEVAERESTSCRD